MSAITALLNQQEFIRRHIGPSDEQQANMLEVIGADTLDQLIQQTVPENILKKDGLNLSSAQSEANTLARLKQIASENIVNTCYMGMGYYPNHTPQSEVIEATRGLGQVVQYS